MSYASGKAFQFVLGGRVAGAWPGGWARPTAGTPMGRTDGGLRGGGEREAEAGAGREGRQAAATSGAGVRPVA